jgi:MFS family permease
MPSDFKKLLCARFLYTFAVQMQAVILGWRIYELLKDPLALGLIGLTEAIPAIGLALYAGYLVDRMKPLIVYRRVMYVSLLSGVFVLVEHLWAHQLSLVAQAGLLYCASALTGFARSFSQPAMFAAIPRIVPRNQLTRASAFSSSVLQIGRIAGPAFGGIVFGFLGAVTASSLVCLILLGASVAMWLMKTDVPAPASTHKHATIKDELLSGARFVFRHPILLPALTLDMVSVLFGGVTALLPIFASDILFIGPKGLGALRAAPAIGAVLVSVALARKSLPGKSGAWLFGCVSGFGACILVFGLSRSFWLSLVVLALSGAFDGISMVIRGAAVQLASPDHMRGKISAVNSIFIGSSNEIGELESGVAAKLLGTVPSVYFGGVMCLLTVGLIAWVSPSLRKLDLAQMEAEKT